MKDWRPLDFVALLLTLALGFVLVYPAAKPEPMSEGELDVYQGIVMAVIGLLGAYIGNTLK